MIDAGYGVPHESSEHACCAKKQFEPDSLTSPSWHLLPSAASAATSGRGSPFHSLAVMIEEYRDIIIQTHLFGGGGSKNSVRAHPVAGQGLSTKLNVECSREMRYGKPVGTMFLVRARIKWTSTTCTTPHIYTSWQWAWREISPEETEKIIKRAANLR